MNQPGFRTSKPTASTPKFAFKNETVENVEKMIDSLKEKTATDSDEINIKLIKDAKKELAPILCKLINLGYNIKAFPNCLKDAIYVTHREVIYVTHREVSDQGGGKTARFLRQKKKERKEEKLRQRPQKLGYDCNDDFSTITRSMQH